MAKECVMFNGTPINLAPSIDSPGLNASPSLLMIEGYRLT